jgi:hypothetical protein
MMTGAQPPPPSSTSINRIVHSRPERITPSL